MEPPLTSRKPRSILLATDLTPVCDRAFDRAVQLAAEWDAELIACHVIKAISLRPGDLERRWRSVGEFFDTHSHTNAFDSETRS